MRVNLVRLAGAVVGFWGIVGGAVAGQWWIVIASAAIMAGCIGLLIGENDHGPR